jgi:hypothetical protein
MSLDPDEVRRRLRIAADRSNQPLVAPPRDRPPTPEEVAVRLREACALSTACARLNARR